MKIRFMVKTESMGHYNHIVLVPLSALPEDCEVPDRLPLETYWGRYSGAKRQILEADMSLHQGHKRGYKFTGVPEPGTEVPISTIGAPEYETVFANGRMQYLIGKIKEARPVDKEGFAYYYRQKALALADTVDISPLMRAIESI